MVKMCDERIAGKETRKTFIFGKLAELEGDKELLGMMQDMSTAVEESDSIHSEMFAILGTCMCHWS